VGIISGGGGGNTTAQVVASGKVIPVANTAGVTVDTTTYNDTIKGSGKLTTLVFPGDQGAMAIAIAGDSFPRWVFAADAKDGLYMGTGANDPVQAGREFGISSDGSTFFFVGALLTSTVETGLITATALTAGGSTLAVGGAGDSLGFFNHAAAAQPTLTSATATPEQIALALESLGIAGGT
jgi:hypothetical protein